MATRRYSNTARQTFLSVGVTAVDPPKGGTINVDDTTGWPTPGAGEESIGALDFENQSKVELFSYTGKTASTLTDVTRGIDGTTAQQHSPGAVVRHCASAKDLEAIASGGLPTVTTKTAAYTLVDDDDVILADATVAGFTLSLPAAAGRSGRTFDIKKIDSSVNGVTVDPNGAETIDGSTTIVLNVQHHSVTLISDGSNWRII